jgi:hypothetical protein
MCFLKKGISIKSELIFFCILKVTDKKSRIRNRNWIHKSKERIHPRIRIWTKMSSGILLLTLHCVSAAEHPDAGIQRKSLSLLSVLATRTNVKSVVDTILNYLRRTDKKDPAIVDKVILYVVVT